MSYVLFMLGIFGFASFNIANRIKPNLINIVSVLLISICLFLSGFYLNV